MTGGRFPVLLLSFFAAPLFGQTSTCEGIAAYTPCEMAFELVGADAAAHPHPYLDVTLDAEFRGPSFKTYKMPAFWDGGNKLIFRFAPTEAGEWIYRISGNVASLEGKQGRFQAAASDSPGYVHAANVHHWWTDNKQPHLWMGCLFPGFATMPQGEWDTALARIAAAKFTHVEASVLGDSGGTAPAFDASGTPNLAYFHELDRRLIETHRRRLTIDLELAANPDALRSRFPDWQARLRFLRFITGRYAPLNITWWGLGEFEGYRDARPLLKEVGLALKSLDPYDHPRSTGARRTSSALLQDGWMTFIIDGSGNDEEGSVEHQLYPVPFIGITKAARIWDSTMDGQYPEVSGAFDKEPQIWFDFISGSRHWELEPYFDVDQARAVALEEAEYLILVRRSGPIEVTLEKHTYDVEWLNPLTGERQESKKYHGEHFTGEEPDGTHPWVLSIAREGHLESMLKSYRFDSRPVPVQEVEVSIAKLPYAIAEPTGDNIPSAVPIPFSVKLTRSTRATRSMMYLWTIDIPSGNQGFRVLGTGASGQFQVPSELTGQLPAAATVRVAAINANGKLYSLDKVYTVSK